MLMVKLSFLIFTPPFLSKCFPDQGATSSPDIQAPPSINPFDGLKSEDEDEEPVVTEGQEDEEEEHDEEVDEAELEAFLDRQLADGLTFLQEPSTFSEPPSKGEEALRTCRLKSKAPL